MKKHTLLILFGLLIGSQVAMAQQDNVTNIRAVQQDKMVTITYDLKDRSDVRLLISIDDGEDTSMSISGLTVGKTYYFRIRCYGSYTNSTTQKTTFSWSQYSDTEEVAVK